MVIQTGRPILNEVEKLTGKDGYERWVSVTKIPRYNMEGQIIGTMGISRDVTKRIKGTKETEKYKKVAIGQNLRMIELEKSAAYCRSQQRRHGVIVVDDRQQRLPDTT